MNLHRPDVAVVSESFQDGSLTGLGALKEIRGTFPETRVILLVKSDGQDLIIQAFRAGARGVVCRTEPVGQLRKCINVVHRGQRWLNAKQLEYVLDAFVSSAPPGRIDPKARLTPRESDVVRLIVEGYTNREAASKLNLREHTISNYLFRIYDKLGISSRVELVLHFLSQSRT